MKSTATCRTFSESPRTSGKIIFGAVIVGGYYLLGGFVVHALFRRYNPKDYQRMSLLQYSTMMIFLLTMIALPLKMMLRLHVAHQIRVDYAVVQCLRSSAWPDRRPHSQEFTNDE